MFQPGFLEQDNSEIILKVKKIKSIENKGTLSKSIPWVSKKDRGLLRWV
jgi:hypothetical protein